MSKLTMHWPSTSGRVKLGDNIMMLSALADYGKDRFKWTVGSYQPNEMNKQLSAIYRKQLPRQVKLDREEVSGRSRMIYHKDHTFPILSPDYINSSPIEGKYCVSHGLSDNPERTIKVPEQEMMTIDLDTMTNLSMDNLFAIIGGAEYFVGTHSGPMWVAVSCGIPVKVYYRPSAKCSHAEHNWNLLRAQGERYGRSVAVLDWT